MEEKGRRYAKGARCYWSQVDKSIRTLVFRIVLSGQELSVTRFGKTVAGRNRRRIENDGKRLPSQCRP